MTERDRVLALLRIHGDATTSFQVLERGLSYAFDEEIADACVAYVDTGAAWGHSSPCIVDLNGDAVDDLLLGDFSGKFRCYLNVGTAAKPKYEAGELLQAGGVTAEVQIYCCIGSQARFHDLNGNGVRDMISNSYDPGHAYLFRGIGAGQFAAREEMLELSGQTLAPVIDVDGEVLADFDTDQLDEFWKKLEKSAA